MENLKYGVKFYDDNGCRCYNEYSNDFFRILFLAFQNRQEKIVSKKRCFPTIWVFDNENNEYVRVHDFSFNVFSSENVKKYLLERILCTDKLLENIEI